MATLDGSVAGAWAGVGRDQLEWLNKTLSSWEKDAPVIVFSHNPLYEYYPPWNFWVRDWREVNEILRPFANVTNIHGHTHQVLYNELGKMRSIGMLATSGRGLRAGGRSRADEVHGPRDPGDHFDGVGWSQPRSPPRTRWRTSTSCGGRTSWRRRRRTPAARQHQSGAAPAHRRPGMALLRRLQVSTRTSRREEAREGAP